MFLLRNVVVWGASSQWIFLKAKYGVYVQAGHVWSASSCRACSIEWQLISWDNVDEKQRLWEAGSGFTGISSGVI